MQQSAAHCGKPDPQGHAHHLNLPVKITLAEGDKIEYLYDATGIKTRKTVTDSTAVTNISYHNGFQYKNNVLQFFPTAEGYVNYTSGSGIDQNQAYNYVYNYTDHLGNIRLSWSKDPTSHALKILEENHYYPFGLKHTNYSSDIKKYLKEEMQPLGIKPVPVGGSVEYKYKYNGFEFQDELELNVYDYENRTYDPATARWWQTDPMAEMGRRWSPYTYAMNNPVYFIDPDGMWPWPTLSTIKSGLKQIKQSLKNEVREAKNGLKNAQRTVSTALMNADNAVIRTAGIAIWVDSNSQKQDGLVKPDVSKNRGKLTDMNMSGMVAAVESMPNGAVTGSKQGDIARDASNVATKSDELSKDTASSSDDKSSIARQTEGETVKMKYLTGYEMSASGEGRNAPSGVMVKSKDTTILKANEKSINDHNKEILNRKDGKTIYGDY